MHIYLKRTKLQQVPLEGDSLAAESAKVYKISQNHWKKGINGELLMSKILEKLPFG
jgi:hypothetical protein